MFDITIMIMAFSEASKHQAFLKAFQSGLPAERIRAALFEKYGRPAAQPTMCLACPLHVLYIVYFPISAGY